MKSTGTNSEGSQSDLNTRCAGTTAWAAACVVLLGVTGCGPAEQNSQTPPAVEHGESPSERLDEKAMVAFDELEPRVEAPRDDEDIPEPQPRAKEALEEAEQLLEEQNNFGAVRLLERAVGFDPDHPAIRRTLGLAYARQRNWAKALENFRRAVEVAPDDLQLQVWLGLLAIGQDRHEDAVIAFRRALKCSDAQPSEPSAAEALLRLAQLLHDQGYYSASLECYRRLDGWIQDHGDDYASRPSLREVVLRPERLLTPKGELLLKLGRADEAVDALERAFSLDRSHTETVRLLLTALLENGQTERAVDVLIDIAAEPAHEEQFVDLAGMLCRRVGDPDLPLRLWRRYRAQGRSDGALAVELAKISADLGATDQAADLLAEALETMPGNARAAREMVRIKSQAGDLHGALSLLVNVVAADADAAEIARAAITEENIDEKLARTFCEEAADAPDERRYAAHYVAGAAAEQVGLEYLAAEQYQSALDAKADFLPAADALTDIYVRQGRLDMVDRLLERLEDGRSEFFRLYLSGKVELARGHARAAVDSLRRAHEIDDTHLPTISLLAEAHRKAGEPAQATSMLRRAITLAPDEVEYYRRLFDLHAILGQHTEAQDVVDALRRRTGNDLAADIMTAELHLARGEHDKARELLADIKSRAPDSFQVELLEVRAAVEAGDEELDEEDFTRAVRVLSQAVERAGGDSMALRLLMQLLQHRDRSAEAVAVWENLYRKTNEPLISRLYVSALVENDRQAQAVGVLEEILAGDPDVYWARYRMLDLLQELDRTEEAVEFANKWLRQTEDDTARQMLYRSLLAMHTEAEDYDAAQEVLDAWLDEARDTDTRRALRVEKMRLYGRTGEYDRALAVVQEADEAVREDVPLKMALLQVLEEGQQYETALGLVQEWLSEADEDSRDMLTHWLINLHVSMEQFDEAQNVAARWIERAPEELRPRAVIVYEFIEAEQFDGASRLVDEWIEQREAATRPSDKETPAEVPDMVLDWCRLTAVRVLLLQNRYEAALERLDSRKWYSTNSEALSMRATCLEQLDRGDEALEALERAYELDPDDPSINNNLGYFYADRGIELARAERLIREALTDLPEETAFLDSLGWVFYKQGRFQAAARVLERALGMGPEGDEETPAAEDAAVEQYETHPVIFDHLGDVYWRLGRHDEALSMWRKALSDAQDEEMPAADVEKVLSEAPLKIEAVEQGREPPIAPLGEGVESEQQDSTE